METKKQAFELIEGICKINNDTWNNLPGSYDDAKEAAYQIEEALEGFDDNMQDLAFALQLDKKYPSDADEVCHPKHLARHIISIVKDGTTMEDVDRFDKALDAIYFAIGSMHKLGLSPHQIVEGLQVVHSANLAKTGEKDSKGKVSKPDNFVPPEEKLQQILDRR